MSKYNTYNLEKYARGIKYAHRKRNYYKDKTKLIMAAAKIARINFETFRHVYRKDRIPKKVGRDTELCEMINSVHEKFDGERIEIKKFKREPSTKTLACIEATKKAVEYAHHHMKEYPNISRLISATIEEMKKNYEYIIGKSTLRNILLDPDEHLRNDILDDDELNAKLHIQSYGISEYYRNLKEEKRKLRQKPKTYKKKKIKTKIKENYLEQNSKQKPSQELGPVGQLMVRVPEDYKPRMYELLPKIANGDTVFGENKEIITLQHIQKLAENKDLDNFVRIIQTYQTK